MIALDLFFEVSPGDAEVDTEDCEVEGRASEPPSSAPVRSGVFVLRWSREKAHGIGLSPSSDDGTTPAERKDLGTFLDS